MQISGHSEIIVGESGHLGTRYFENIDDVEFV